MPPNCLDCSSLSAIQPAPRSPRREELFPRQNKPPAFRDDEEHLQMVIRQYKARHELGYIEAELEKEKTQYSITLAHRATLLRDPLDYDTILNPIPRIPVEILSYIFILARNLELIQTHHTSTPFYFQNPLSILGRIHLGMCRESASVGAM